MERDMFHLRKCGFDGFTKRGCASGKPDIKNRANRGSAAVLFSVVKAKSAVAVFLRIFIWAAVFSAASLYAARRAYHHCFYTVEGRGVSKMHFDRSFLWNEKSQKSFSKLRAKKRADKSG
ncbi:MAG: hypothetical protein KHW87_08190 [Clostridiales bacterium]|nr:hypothetical protein [Clostridiales bacterium]